MWVRAEAELRGRQREGEEAGGERLLTGQELEDAGDGEPLSFGEGEELSDEHKDAQDGEYTGQDGAGLHCLEVLCRGRQREQ